MKRLLVGVLVLLCAGDAFARMEGIADAPAVRHQNLMRKGRHELTPAFGVTLMDPYTRNVLAQFSYKYHITDWIAVHAEFDYAAPFKTGLTEDIEREVSSEPIWMSAHPGQQYRMSRTGLGMMILGGASLTPLAGKLSLFGLSAYADFHVDVGAGVALVEGINRLSGSTAVAIMVGAGFRFFPHKAFSVNFDVRDYMVSRTLNLPSTGGTSRKRLTQNPTVMMGVSFFLPLTPAVGP